MSEVTVQPTDEPQAITFLKEKHELTALLKKLDKAAVKAVELLTDTMNDPKKDEKTRLECANKIIGFYMAASKQINDEDMARLIAQVRLAPGKPVHLKPGEIPTPDKPKLDFTSVRQV